jgi:putative nucleotidyltransferase with HDIG domain
MRSGLEDTGSVDLAYARAAWVPSDRPATGQAGAGPARLARIRVSLASQLRRVNSELWVIFALFGLAGLLNVAAGAHSAVLSLYSLPTIVSAYLYGRRHASLTALGSALLVALLMQTNSSLLVGNVPGSPEVDRWLTYTAWGATLIVTAYLMGTLYEHRAAQLREVRETYHGVLMILRHFVAKDSYTENHCYRVSVYAARIATEMGMTMADVEDVRAAALLHDIGKLKVSRDLLHKAAKLTETEHDEMREHVARSAEILEPAGGALRRILPMVLAHHDHYDGAGERSRATDREIPAGARVIAVADNYDAMISDRPYRKAMSPFEAKDIIEKGSGRDFDPDVVEAFLRLCRRQELDIPSVVV